MCHREITTHLIADENNLIEIFKKNEVEKSENCGCHVPENGKYKEYK